MDIKQIVFTQINKAELIDAKTREVGENDVLVKIEFTTISNGTERANITGVLNVNGDGEPDKVARFPRFAGYSGAGIICEVGDKVKKVKVGDRVATSWGVHATYCVLPEDNVEIIDDDISFSEASLTHISTFPMAAIRKTRLEFGESAIVMGLGILGIFAVQLLKFAGAIPIIAVDPSQSRRELALKLGADYALNPFDDDFVKRARELTNGGANVAIEVTGLGKGLEQILDCMAPFGRVALLGCTRNPDFTIDYYRKIHCPGITLIGAHTMARPVHESYPGYWTTSDDKKVFLKLLKEKRITLNDIIHEVHSPKEAPEVFLRLATDPEFPFGVQFDWSKI